MKLKCDEVNQQLPLEIKGMNPAARVAKIYVLPGENCEGLSLVATVHRVSVVKDEGGRRVDRVAILANLGPMTLGHPICQEIRIPSDPNPAIRFSAINTETGAWHLVDGITDEGAKEIADSLEGEERAEFQRERRAAVEAQSPVLRYVNVYEGAVT